MEDKITTQQVADLLGISASAVSRLAARGSIAYVWFAGRRFFSKREILALRDDPAYQRRSRRLILNALVASGTLSVGKARR